jgi:hypothetical protein
MGELNITTSSHWYQPQNNKLHMPKQWDDFLANSQVLLLQSSVVFPTTGGYSMYKWLTLWQFKTANWKTGY